MKNTGWIKFVNKLPYSAIDGREPPYDFPVLVALRVRPHDPISYEVWSAKKITEHYKEYPRLQPNIIAWQGINEYTEPRG